ncbi:hypothetical protein [Brevibacterium luteolum]|uniref:hypothetical protein n=1 Tax=Brevibacterium luteolum TaxID=199591 RepID=UPI001C231064|nr:hypothetical protein [Brevibacterium luteolum]MBU8579067.1 hypothetical protein [Brevibacterium luteolum]
MSPSARGQGSQRRRPGSARGARPAARSTAGSGGGDPRRPDPAVYRRRRIVVGVLALIVVCLLVLGIVLMVKAIQKVRQDSRDQAAAEAAAAQSPEPTLPAPIGDEASGACPADAVEIIAGTDEGSYAPGASATLELTVKNNHDVACAISVGPEHQVFEIRQDGKTQWSTEYCTPGGDEADEDVRVFAPGTERKSTLKWQMTPTDKNCNRTGDSFEAGEYELVTKLGEVESKPARFTVEELSPEPTEKPEDEG